MPDFRTSSTGPRRTNVRVNPHGGEGPSRPVQRWLQPGWLVLAAGVLSLVVLGPRIWKWLPDLRQRPEYQLRTADIVVADLPRWVPRKLVAEVVERGQLGTQRSLLEPNLLPEIARAFEQHPWVEKVIRISKGVPARITVEVQFRKPVAMVELPTGVLPIDSQGVLLPPSDFTPEDARRYPLILNVSSSPRGGPGHPWGDPQVAGAAKLAGALLPHWNEFQLEAVLLPGATASVDAKLWEGNFQVVTRGGSRILWGRAPGVVYPGELTAEQKLGRLEECVTRFGGFDQPDGPYEIDIRHFQEITRIRLTAEQARPQRVRR